MSCCYMLSHLEVCFFMFFLPSLFLILRDSTDEGFEGKMHTLSCSKSTIVLKVVYIVLLVVVKACSIFACGV